MNQLWSLRGHINPITTIQEFSSNKIISTDDHGWIIVWDVSLRNPLYCWKGHDKTILTTLSLDAHHFLTHSKDSEIKIWNLENCTQLTSDLPDIQFNDLTYLKDDTSQLIERFPLPTYDSIPVNTLNFCNIDYHDGLLITPSTVDSENFDIYQLDYREFSLSRLVHNISPFGIYKKFTGYIEEVNSGKRDGFGIMMRIKFVKHDEFYIGFESGHLAGFRINIQDAKESTKKNLKSVINRDPTISMIYYNEFHIPNPVLSMELFGTQLLVGATGKNITVHDIYGEDVKAINVKTSGIQAIQVMDELVVVGFWNGTIKIFNKDFDLVQKHKIALPQLNNVTTNNHQEATVIETNEKLSAMKMVYLKSNPSSSKYKSLVLKRKVDKFLVFGGYNIGKIMVFELSL